MPRDAEVVDAHASRNLVAGMVQIRIAQAPVYWERVRHLAALAGKHSLIYCHGLTVSAKGVTPIPLGVAGAVE